MEYPAFSSKALALNNLVTCIYLPAMLFTLQRTGNLYIILKHSSYMELVLLVTEVIKYLNCCMSLPKPAKKYDAKRLNGFLRGVLMLVVMCFIFYIVAVLFGAPVFSEHYETLTFAAMLTVLTVLPCCLYLGPDSVPILFTSLLTSSLGTYNTREIQENFLLNVRLTIFGAWLGAIVVPLDWDKPYQAWPIPCCLGAIFGCFVANLALFMMYCVPPSRTKTKYDL